jgi:hypothetical protein
MDKNLKRDRKDSPKDKTNKKSSKKKRNNQKKARKNRIRTKSNHKNKLNLPRKEVDLFTINYTPPSQRHI